MYMVLPWLALDCCTIKLWQMLLVPTLLLLLNKQLPRRLLELKILLNPPILKFKILAKFKKLFNSKLHLLRLG